MKKVIIQFTFPGATGKTLDKAWEECRAKGYAHPKGLLHHVGGVSGNNLVVTDVWESVELFNKFGEILGLYGTGSVIPILSRLLLLYIMSIMAQAKLQAVRWLKKNQAVD